MLSHLIVMSVLSGRCYYYLGFIDEETKAERGNLEQEVICPRLQSCKAIESGSEPRQSDSRTHALNLYSMLCPSFILFRK